MEAEQYLKEVTRTVVILPTLEENLYHCALGVSTEIGELHDIYKKELAYGKQIDLINLKEELGDIIWYVFNAINFLEKQNELNKIEDQKEGAVAFLSSRSLAKTKNIVSHLHKNTSDIFNDLSKDIINTNVILRNFVCVYYDVYVLCRIYEFDIQEIMEININKLRVRFPEKFTQDRALNRNLDEERKELEK